MEISILEWINNNLHGSSVVNQVFRFITYLGEDGIAWLLVGLVLLCFKKTRRVGLLVLAGFASVVVINHLILKNIIDRPRPFTESAELAEFIKSIGMSLPTSSSFPSGHTTISITSAVILTMCFGKKGAWSFMPAVLISLSRIFLCVHYPTDVLGGVIEGVILGVAVTYLGKFILNKLENWWETRKVKKLALANNTQEEPTMSSDNNESKASEVITTIEKSIKKTSTKGTSTKKKQNSKTTTNNKVKKEDK